MQAILSDHNIVGQVRVLASVWTSPDWLELWQSLGYAVESFASLGIAKDTPDSEVWNLRQQREKILITANRNAEGDDSLEVSMRRLGRQDSLPVLTIADPDRVMTDRLYAERVAVAVLAILLDLDRYRGTRRLYVP